MFKKAIVAALLFASLSVAQPAEADQAHLNWAAGVAKNAQINAYFANPNMNTYNNAAGSVYLEWYIQHLGTAGMNICEIRSHYQRIYNGTSTNGQVNQSAKFWTGHVLDVIDMYHQCP